MIVAVGPLPGLLGVSRLTLPRLLEAGKIRSGLAVTAAPGSPTCRPTSSAPAGERLALLDR